MSYILRENAICFFSFSKEYADPFSLESYFGFAAIHCTANIVGGRFASWEANSVGSSLCRFSIFEALCTIYLLMEIAHPVSEVHDASGVQTTTYVTALF